MNSAAPSLLIVGKTYKALVWLFHLTWGGHLGIASVGIARRSGLVMPVIGAMACFLASAPSFAEFPVGFHVVHEGDEPGANSEERCACDLFKSPDCTPTTWQCYGSFEKGIIFEYEHVLSCEQSAQPDGSSECVKVTEKRTVQCGVFATEQECKDGGIVKEVKLPLECDAKCRIAEQPRWIPCDLAKKLPGKEGFEEVLSECEQCSVPGACGKSYCFGVRLDPDNNCEPSLEPAIAGCTWGKELALSQSESWTPAASSTNDHF